MTDTHENILAHLGDDAHIVAPFADKTTEKQVLSFAVRSVLNATFGESAHPHTSLLDLPYTDLLSCKEQWLHPGEDLWILPEISNDGSLLLTALTDDGLPIFYERFFGDLLELSLLEDTIARLESHAHHIVSVVLPSNLCTESVLSYMQERTIPYEVLLDLSTVADRVQSYDPADDKKSDADRFYAMEERVSVRFADDSLLLEPDPAAKSVLVAFFDAEQSSSPLYGLLGSQQIPTPRLARMRSSLLSFVTIKKSMDAQVQQLPTNHAYIPIFLSYVATRMQTLLMQRASQHALSLADFLSSLGSERSQTPSEPNNANVGFSHEDAQCPTAVQGQTSVDRASSAAQAGAQANFDGVEECQRGKQEGKGSKSAVAGAGEAGTKAEADGVGEGQGGAKKEQEGQGSRSAVLGAGKAGAKAETQGTFDGGEEGQRGEQEGEGSESAEAGASEAGAKAEADGVKVGQGGEQKEQGFESAAFGAVKAEAGAVGEAKPAGRRGRKKGTSSSTEAGTTAKQKSGAAADASGGVVSEAQPVLGGTADGQADQEKASAAAGGKGAEAKPTARKRGRKKKQEGEKAGSEEAGQKQGEFEGEEKNVARRSRKKAEQPEPEPEQTYASIFEFMMSQQAKGRKK
ncbi:MAG: hypothetical protein IJU76_11360 [Desulfovibrionaceae bacterium]|nr:hypothetical protein [Desulfovibrionaceae bacterium]